MLKSSNLQYKDISFTILISSDYYIINIIQWLIFIGFYTPLLIRGEINENKSDK